MIKRLPGWCSDAMSGAVVVGLAVIVIAELGVRATPLPDMARVTARSQVITDKDGGILWAFLASDQRWRLETHPGDVDPQYLRLLIAYEDKRFYTHRGVDPLALVRATWQAVRYGRVVSGASTLTMQTVRLLQPEARALSAKVRQIFAALKLERRYSKEKILSAYLTLAPFGGNIEGVRAASLSYFGKEPTRLSARQAALLVSLPQSPEALRPGRSPARARDAAEGVLQRLAARGVETGASSASRPGGPPLTRGARSISRLAPHLAERLRRASPHEPLIRTTIDARVQTRAEAIARAAVAGTEGVNAAILVVRLKDMSVAAYVGGADFYDDTRAGQFDHVEAIRSPGSALKPFIYAMAFERLIVHPDTIITDEPIDYDGYEPENFDASYSGDMKVRTALIRSVNTAAVSILHEVGPTHFMSRLRSVGAPLKTENSDDQAGLAIALGGGGMTLADLTRLYAGLASGGRVAPLRLRSDDPQPPSVRLVSPAAARAVTEILADIQPPQGFARRTSQDGGRRIAFKTGTSYGFRDAWAVGYDREHAVGVWIGRPDGTPHLGAYGISAAAPLMLQVFDALPVPRADVAQTGAPLGALASPRILPERLRRFELRDSVAEQGPVAIRFPRNDAVVAVDRDAGAGLPLIVRGGTPPYQWYVDGAPLSAVRTDRTRWRPPTSGQFDVTVIDAGGRSARSSFWVE
jgi:penicillin-binding protein 1C